jgi:multidrug efflux pump subunit AcrA (membrane-fusion protein)
MGGPYLTHAKFALAKVSLPADLDAAVGRARAAFAQVSEAQARVQSAQADAQATQAKAQAYQNCPGCLTLDQTRALGDALAKLQPGAVFAPGGNGLNLNVPAVR